MSKDNNLKHEFLNLRAGGHSDHGGHSDQTFLGNLRLAARTRLFLVAGLLAMAAFAALFLVIDKQVTAAADEFAEAEKMAALAAAVETGIVGARGEEKKFLLQKDPVIAESFNIRLEFVSKALGRLTGMAKSVTLRKPIDTIRDGLAQYDRQFSKLVKSEKAMGLTDGTGLSRELRNATEELQVKFSTTGYTNLAGQVSRINQEGQETLLSGYKKGVGEIQKRYQTLITFLKETKIPERRKKALQELLQKHETILLAMINSRFTFEEEAQRFDDILTYLGPSTSVLSGFAATRRGLAAEDLAWAGKISRIAIAGGSVVIVLSLMIVGLIMLRSMSEPIRVLANIAGRLADGDGAVSLPARGNSDSVGTLARAFDKWVQNLADLEQLRQKLDHTRAELEKTLAEAEKDAMVAAEAARAALLAEDKEEAAPRAQILPGPDADDIATGGPLSSVSRKLANFSEYVTAAASDVERTGALVKGLEDASRQIEEVDSLVTAIRDQTNLLAFRAGPKEQGGDNLVILSGEDKEPAEDSQFPDVDMAKRFDAIRDATNKAERTSAAVRGAMADVTRMAQEIAATASEQALEATSKLLNQSEYLQNMLDDVISKIQPATPGTLTLKGSGKKETQGKTKGKKKGKSPSKKA
ncbi:MAG: hypothetical protein CMM60_07485 [Rhodospirillaceae bacterium]|jgi:methyl-accepting chemotaxis protein|nr:hypothetical protein [Rhodospirillaceae bacterium]|tara:strand:- start:1274 stop:3196 length:1923 start_codon:yes stop_codon:yes gene_type:complete